MVWYSSGRKEIPSILDQMPKDDSGRVASAIKINEWRRKYDWEVRADDLDEKALMIVSDGENGLVQRKADMLRRQAEMGWQLQEIGMRYLISGSFDTAASAVQAIKLGVEMERSSRGISDLIIKMSKMTDEELQEEILKQIDRASQSGQVIDAEDVGDMNEE